MSQSEVQINAQRLYGNRIRVRACGICIENDRVLMIGHRAILGENTFWSPPGGGVEVGEMAEDALKREFLEETGLEISVGKLLLMNEFVKLPLHGIELFFVVKRVGGELILGHDPEMDISQQLIQKVEWFSLDKIKRLNLNDKHHLWKKYTSFDQIIA